MTAEAARIGAPFAVGITEDAPNEHFLNAQVVVTPDGRSSSRYEKVRRVPFGEYMPLRGLLQRRRTDGSRAARRRCRHGPA